MDSHLDVERHMRRILDCSPSVIYTKDLQGCYTSINKQFEISSGLKRGEVIGRNDFELFPESVAKNSTINDRHVIQSGTPLESEEFAPVQGEMHWFSSIKYPLLTDDGKIYGICGVSTDITEQREVEEALKNSEERYRSLFDRMPSGCAVYSAEGDGDDFIFKDFNKTAEAIEKIKKEDLLGRSVTDVFPGVKKFGKFKVFQDAWQNGETKYFPPACYKDDYQDEDDPGTWRESWVYKLSNGDIVSLYNDVTERIHAEERLHESEEKYRALFNQSVAGIYLHDLDGRILDVNPIACLQVGYSKDELLRRTVFDLQPIERSKVNLSKTEILNEWRKWETGDVFYIEAEHRRKDNTVFPVQLSTGVVRYGNTRNILAVTIDITQLKQTQKELSSKTILLEGVLDAIRDVIGIMAPDRTIMRYNE